MKQLLNRFYNQIIQFLQMQLFLSLASLPILVAWGIPFSLATVMGNFLFSPFLTLFLLISSLIFFTELIFIPNAWLIVCLEHLSAFWLWALSFGTKKWLVGFPVHGLWIAFVGSLCGFIIMQHKVLGRKTISLIVLIGISGATVYALSYVQPYSQEIKVSCGKKAAQVIVIGSSIVIKDNGLFSLKKAGQSWVEYNLLPDIIKKTGSLTVELVVAQCADGNTFQALKELLLHASVKKIILPYFLHNLSAYEWRLFYEFKALAKKENCIIIRKKDIFYEHKKTD